MKIKRSTRRPALRRRTLVKEDIPDEVLKPIVKKIIDEHEDILKRFEDEQAANPVTQKQN